MGLRFRKSFKVAPGVKVNLNKKSAGVTLGTKGAHYTINTSGRRTASVGLPGTGLSYSTSSGGKKKGTRKANTKASKKAALNKWIGIVIAVVAIACAAGAIKSSLDKKAVNAPAAITAAENATAKANTAAVENAAAKTDTAAVENTAKTDSAVAENSSPAAAGTKVWISGSGKKYHTRPDCSGMENATEVTLEEALDMGKEPCKRCN